VEVVAADEEDEELGRRMCVCLCHFSVLTSLPLFFRRNPGRARSSLSPPACVISVLTRPPSSSWLLSLLRAGEASEQRSPSDDKDGAGRWPPPPPLPDLLRIAEAIRSNPICGLGCAFRDCFCLSSAVSPHRRPP
jgi:hypothetical protein